MKTAGLLRVELPSHAMRTLVVFAVISASTAAAQEDLATPDAGTDAPVAEPAPAAPAPEAAVPSPVTSTVLPVPGEPTASPKRALVLQVARIALEAVLGAGIGFLGELTGAYVGLNIDILSGHESAAGLSIGAAFGAILAVAPGVWLGGTALGGDGSFGWTMLGGAIGTAASAALIGIKNNTATLVIAAALPVLSSILGYELSAHRHKILPTVGANGVGVTGVF
jgi:hypothetical protein